MSTLAAKWLIAEILSDSTLAAAIGARIFPVRLPQRKSNEEAFIDSMTYRLAGSQRVQAMDGFTGEMIDIYQLRFWSSSYDQSRALADSAIATIDSRADDPEEVTVEGDTIVIQRTSVLSPSDDEQAPYLADDAYIYAVVVPFEVAYLTEEVLTERS